MGAGINQFKCSICWSTEHLLLYCCNFNFITLCSKFIFNNCSLSFFKYVLLSTVMWYMFSHISNFSDQIIILKENSFEVHYCIENKK